MAPAVTCECGVCGKCKRRVYMRQWYARPENTDRHRATSRASRDRRLAAVQAYDRKRGFRVYDAVKVAARRAVGHAVARGKLTPHSNRCTAVSVIWVCPVHGPIIGGPQSCTKCERSSRRCECDAPRCERDGCQDKPTPRPDYDPRIDHPERYSDGPY